MFHRIEDDKLGVELKEQCRFSLKELTNLA
jgi:hypothetical protein